jgi:hypothetical protein
MKLFASSNRTGSIWVPIVTGLGGVLIGAAVVSMVTPKTGSQMRRLVTDLFRRGRQQVEQEGDELERMAGEGGIGQGYDERAY